MEGINLSNGEYIKYNKVNINIPLNNKIILGNDRDIKNA